MADLPLIDCTQVLLYGKHTKVMPKVKAWIMEFRKARKKAGKPSSSQPSQPGQPGQLEAKSTVL